MRAKLIYEKFKEQSDPIQDMGIGGFKLNNEYVRIKNEAAKKWVTFLKDKLEGKIIKGTMMRWDGHHDWKTYTSRVKKVMNDVEKNGFNFEVNVQDEDEILYTILGHEKLYIR